MKNINYSIKSNLKYRTKESVCCPCSLERSVGLLKQLLLLEEIYSNYSSSTEGEIITQSHRTVNAKRIPTSFFRMKEASHSTRKHYTIAAQVRSLQQLGKIYYFHTISIRIIIGLHKSNMEPSEWREIIHQNTYQKFHRKHRRRLPLSFRERYTQYKTRFPTHSTKTLQSKPASIGGTHYPP